MTNSIYTNQGEIWRRTIHMGPLSHAEFGSGRGRDGYGSSYLKIAFKKSHI